MMAKRLRGSVFLFSVCLLIAPLLLSCGSVDDEDLMAGAVAPPDETGGNSTIEYLTEDGQSFNVTVMEGQVILLFDSGVSDPAVESLVSSNGGSIIAKIPSIRYYLAGVASGGEMSFIDAMRQESDVSVATPNVPLGACHVEPPNEWEEYTPYFSWHLKEIRADLAWELLKSATLSEKRIEFVEMASSGAFNGLSSGSEDFQGRITGEIPAELPWPHPSEGHGTTVAAVAAATGNNGFGNVGVNWISSISFNVAYTLFDLPYQVVSTVNAGADVVNLSSGPPDCFGMRVFYMPVLFGVVSALKTQAPGKKVVVVQAAGNSGCELVPFMEGYSPAKPDNLVLVGATEHTGGKLQMSNYGNIIDIAAPGAFGMLYYSTGILHDVQGTSLAAPLVAGAAALVWAKEPNLTPQQVIQRLKDTAQPFANLGDQYIGKLGAGILDVYRALDPEGTSLTIAATTGGSVTVPGEGAFICDTGTVVNLVATPASGYLFSGWTGDVSTIGNVNAASTTITMNGDYTVTATFSPAAGITVIYNNGGYGADIWGVGSTQIITWTSSGVTGNVNIGISRDSGQTWSDFITNTPNTGSYSWTVTGPADTHCRVRVMSSSNSNVWDASNGDFTITSGAWITVTSPNGGENWAVGSTHTIAWTSSGVGNVNIGISRDGGSGGSDFISNTPNTGSYSWTVTGPATNQARILITSSSDGNVWDKSNGNFVIG